MQSSEPQLLNDVTLFEFSYRRCLHVFIFHSICSSSAMHLTFKEINGCFIHDINVIIKPHIFFDEKSNQTPIQEQLYVVSSINICWMGECVGHGTMAFVFYRLVFQRYSDHNTVKEKVVG